MRKWLSEIKWLKVYSRSTIAWCAVVGSMWLFTVGFAGIFEVPIYVRVGNNAPHLMGGGMLASCVYMIVGFSGAISLLVLPIRRLVRMVKRRIVEYYSNRADVQRGGKPYRIG